MLGVYTVVICNCIVIINALNRPQSLYVLLPRVLAVNTECFLAVATEVKYR